MNVKETHWAQAARKNFALFLEGLPATLTSEEDLWQLRVDRGAKGEETKCSPHARLHLVTALEYRSENGTSAPTGQGMSFLALGDTHREAMEKVRAQLAEHGLGESWMISMNSAILVLQ